MRSESLRFLKELLSAPTPSGHEAPGQRVWCEYARRLADEVVTDSYGNAVAVLNPEGSPRIMLDGHVDEIGLMVKHVDDKGFVYFQRIGGVDPALVRGKRVSIHTAKGVVRGVVGATAIHLHERGKEPKVPKMLELFIDIGADGGKAARRRVSVGDPITFADDFEMITDHLAVARAFDNRAGTWAVIEALRLARRPGLNCAVCACSSVQEETGLNGAKMQVFNVRPDAGIAVDVTHATDTPGIDPKQHGEVKMGAGPALALGRENARSPPGRRSRSRSKPVPRPAAPTPTRSGRQTAASPPPPSPCPTATCTRPSRCSTCATWRRSPNCWRPSASTSKRASDSS